MCVPTKAAEVFMSLIGESFKLHDFRIDFFFSVNVHARNVNSGIKTKKLPFFLRLSAACVCVCGKFI
jgi:hypothetical protein